MTFFRKSLLLAAAAVLSSGCAGSIRNMREVARGAPEPAPAPGKAMIVFLRPSGMGYAIQSSVFEVKDGSPELVGIVAAKAKVAWQVDPGQHLFMTVGESGDFMSADVVAGRTYFARVTPRMGVWKARFSLDPVSSAELAAAEFGRQLEGCRWVELSPESAAWAAGSREDVKAKLAAYYPKWQAKAEQDRPKLLPDDGR